jgi:hypothetical protein
MEASADAGAASAAAAAARTLRWAGRAGHLGGFPRAAVFAAVGAFAKAYASLLNTTTVHNSDALLRLVSARGPGTPLLTVSNHMSTCVRLTVATRLPFPGPCTTFDAACRFVGTVAEIRHALASSVCLIYQGFGA